MELSEARDLAASLPGVMMRGQTDSSQGMVGALAGAGLRLGGEDGRFRGKWDLTPFARQAIYGDTPVATMHDCVGLFSDQGIDARFVDMRGNLLDDDDEPMLIPDAKPILRRGAFTIASERKLNGRWLPCTKKSFIAKVGHELQGCECFVGDPDVEEHVTEADLRSCGSCLYRRFDSDGMPCSLGLEVAPL